MLKRNIKIILIGLCFLGVLGVLYSVLNTQPEMVANQTLRVMDEPHPEIDRIVKPLAGDEDLSTSSVFIARGVSIEPVLMKQGAERLVEVLHDASSQEVELESAFLVDSIAPLEALPDQEAFVNLNLVEEKKLASPVLLEGDEEIIDEVSKALGQYQQLIEAVSQPQLASKEKKQVTVSQESDPSAQQESVDMSEVSAMNRGLVMPKVDKNLMQGTDAVSLEYQASFKKLKEVRLKLVQADVENESLNKQFDLIADDNRKLAQIIRDLDVKIKAIRITN